MNKRREEAEADEIISRASNTMLNFFANKDLNDDNNWKAFDNKHNPHTKQKNQMTKPPVQQQQQQQKPTTHQSSTQSNLDEIEKLAKLRDLGIVTEQEFQMKKNQLLGISSTSTSTAQKQKLPPPPVVKPQTPSGPVVYDESKLNKDQKEKIDKLKQYREKGLLTRKDFDKKVQDVLNGK